MRDLGDVGESIIPVRTTRAANMSCRFHVQLGIQTPGGNQNRMIRVLSRHRAAAVGTKSFSETRAFDQKDLELILSRQPIHPLRFHEHIRAMGRARDLPATAAVAQKEAEAFALDAVLYRSAQTRPFKCSHLGISFHDYSAVFTFKCRMHGSSSMRRINSLTPRATGILAENFSSTSWFFIVRS